MVHLRRCRWQHISRHGKTPFLERMIEDAGRSEWMIQNPTTSGRPTYVALTIVDTPGRDEELCMLLEDPAGSLLLQR